jgi:UPF0755 protein
VRRLLLLVTLLALGVLGLHHAVFAPLRSPLDPPDTLLVPQGATTDSIARQLEEKGLVSNRYVFRAAVLLRGGQGRLRAGEYALDGPLSLGQIVDLLARGEVIRHEITFPEGLGLEESAAVGASAGVPVLSFLWAASDPAPIHDIDPEARDLEGYLFPDTYDLPRGADAAQALVSRMVQRFRAVLEPELPLLARSGLNLREVVTLASLVELETARPEERPRVAAVFLNRLRRGMPLQTDPTVIYAMRKAGSYQGTISHRDLDIESPYNTYRHAGLPPGPIASPGRQSIEAVLSPAPVADLYFVSRNDGTHQFSETLAEHEKAVDRYQRSRKLGSPKAKG